MADQFYFEEGYLEAGYFSVVREASASLSTSASLSATVDIADTTGYYIPDYIAEGYYALPVQEASASLSASTAVAATATRIQSSDASLAVAASASTDGSAVRDAISALNTTATQTATAGTIKQGACDFGALFTPSVVAVAKINMTAIVDSVVSFEATANRTRDNDIALQNAVNLSLQAARIASAASNLASNVIQTTQAARTRDTQSSLAVSASIVAQGDAGIIANATLDGSFDVSVTATVTIIKEASASITASNSLTANAIQYQTKPPATTLEVLGAPEYDLIEHTTALSKFGAGSARRELSVEENISTVAPVWNGSQWAILDGFGEFGATQKIWFSSDLVTWTENNTDLPVGFNDSAIDFKYLNSQYIVLTNNGYYVSSNGTNYTLYNPATLNNSTNFELVSGQRNIIYYNGYYYAHFRYKFNGLESHIGRSTSLTASNWTSVNQINGSSAASINEIVASGNTIAYLYYYRSSASPTVHRFGIRYSSNGTSWSDTLLGGFSSSNFITRLAIDGSTIYHTRSGDGIYQNATQITSGSYLDIDVINGKFITLTSAGIDIGSSFTSTTALNKIPAPSRSSNINQIFGFGNSTYVYLSRDNTTTPHRDVGHSTDAITWTYNETPIISANKAGLYYTNDNIQNWKTIDLWFYLDSPVYKSNYVPLLSIGDVDIYFWTIISASGRIGYATPSISGYGTFLSGEIEYETWHHVRVLLDGTNLKVYLNGVQNFETNSYSNTLYSNIGVLANKRISIQVTNESGAELNYNVDDVYITSDLLNTYSDTTITVPSTAYTTDANTILYLPYDASLQEPVVPQTLAAEAAFASTFSLSVDPTFKITGASLQQSSGTLTADVNVTKQSSLSINASANITVDSTRVRFANSSQSSQFAQTVDAVKRVGVASSQSSLFALPNVDYIRTRNANIDTDAIATQLAVVAKAGEFFVNIDAAFVQTATVVKRTNTDSALSASFVQTVSVIKAVNASASLASAFAQADVDSVRYRSTQAALDTNATQDASAVKTVDVNTAQSSAFTQTVDGKKFSGNQVALNSEFAQADTAFIRLRDTALDVDVVATQSATAIKAVQAILTVGATTALTAQPLRIRPGVIDTDAIASQLTVAAKTGDFLINADVVATLSVDAVVTTGNTVAIRAEFAQTVVNDRIRETASSQTTTAELTAEPIIGVSASASINTATTLTVDAVAVKDAVVDIDGAMTFDATVRANLVGEIPVDIVSTLSATPSITREVGVTLSSDIAQTTTVSKQVPASASINSAFTQTANGRLIVFLEQLIYTVPRETRAYKIRNESREFVVDNESRTYQVRG